MDLTVVAIPAYFGGMGAEYRYLKAHADDPTLAAGQYQREDTLASLAMGLGSLIAPMALGKLLGPVTPGKGRYGKVLVGGALAAATVTTVADILGRKGDGPLPPAGVVPAELRPGADVAPDAGSVPDPEPDEGNRSARRRAAQQARRVASSAGASALVAGGVAVATSWASRTAGRRLFARRPGPDLGNGPLAVAGAILAWDFVYYWNHRAAHESRYLWAMHVVHHSSERYNLSTALRQPVADAVTVNLPYGALALLGFRPEVIETARGVNLLYQFWIHTETIRSIGWAERYFNSPSLHRVHHGSNRQYLDRNHGSILIVWDRLFGTHEVEEEPVVYGLTKNIDTYNPARIASHEWAAMVRDVRNATSWSERLGFVFRGPGWAYERTTGRPIEVPVPATDPSPVERAGVA